MVLSSQMGKLGIVKEVRESFPGEDTTEIKSEK